MEKELYKNRSFSACIHAAYVLFATNLKVILRRTWLPVLLMSVALTFNVLFNLPDKHIHDLGMSHPMLTTSIMGAAFILNLLAEIWIMAVIAGLLNLRPLKANIVRALVLMGISLIITLAAIAIISFSQNFVLGFLISSKLVTPSMAGAAGVGITLLLVMLLLVFTLPFVFSTTKFLMDHEVRPSAIFKSDYRRGLRRWGMLFGALFFTTVIITILSFVLFVPFIILVTSQTINQIGMLNGDPSGVPGYFFWLLSVITLLTMFIFSYEIIWAMLVNYYVYGAIEAKEKLKEENNGLKNESSDLTETNK